MREALMRAQRRRRGTRTAVGREKTRTARVRAWGWGWGRESLIGVTSCSLEQVDGRPDEDPDEVDEAPVEAGDLEAVVGGEALGDPDGHGPQVDDAGEDVEAVEAGDDEEGEAEGRHAPGVGVEAGAVEDEVGPLVGLEAEEEGAGEDGDDQELDGVAAGALAHSVHGEGHGGAAADEDGGHEGHEADVHDLEAVGPGGAAQAGGPQADEEAGEGH